MKAIEQIKTDHASVKASLASAEKERDELKTKVAAANKSRAESLVKAAVADGRILPKDEDKQKKFRERIESGDSFAEEILATLPKKNADIDKTIVTAASGEKLPGSGEFQAEARKLVTAGEAKTEEEAMSLIAARNPALYDSYTESLVS